MTQDQIRKILGLTIGRPAGPPGGSASATPAPVGGQPPFAFQPGAPGVRGPAPGTLPQGLPPNQPQQHTQVPSNKFLQVVSKNIQKLT